MVDYDRNLAEMEDKLKNSDDNRATKRRQIEEQAACLYRERGVDSASVIEVMNLVGMTHGGFYKHYSSKAELAELACKAAFSQVESARCEWRQTMHSGTNPIEHYADQYLAKRHRDDPGTGCPIVGFLNDVIRGKNIEGLKGEYAKGLEKFIFEIRTLLKTNDLGNSDYKSHAILAMLVGALSISRATQGKQISDDILESVKKFIKDQNF